MRSSNMSIFQSIAKLYPCCCHFSSHSLYVCMQNYINGNTVGYTFFALTYEIFKSRVSLSFSFPSCRHRKLDVLAWFLYDHCVGFPTATSGWTDVASTYVHTKFVVCWQPGIGARSISLGEKWISCSIKTAWITYQLVNVGEMSAWRCQWDERNILVGSFILLYLFVKIGWLISFFILKSRVDSSLHIFHFSIFLSSLLYLFSLGET